MLSEINQLQKDKYSSFHLYKFPRVVKSMGTQNRMLQGLEGVGNGELLLHESRASDSQNEKFWRGVAQ